MNSLQRSSISFRRQGSSGLIWNDQRQVLELKTSSPPNSPIGVENFRDKEDVSPHASSSSGGSNPTSPPSSARTQRCALSAVFGKCIGSPTTT
ncbi:hypothetical protein BVC80_9097g206 [Macleaya cordata]|uniref:Uncharacterized protein n=1 Tax=Macleaya cordata TaxID=56857 RepID=A0A200QF63_MACCD|nr:hypothetical protein BVC80_9097g206 [Macleaya cordata]